MKNNNPFSGLGVAVVTPFHKQSTSIDFTSLKKTLENLIEKKVDYLVALGTTSESPTLSAKEKMAVVDFMLDIVDNRLPIVLGIGGNDTYETVEKIKETSFEGISGILSVCPYYNKPSQKGIYLHYKNISDVSPLPIIIYNIPGRTGVKISVETTLKIANEMPNVVATKEASGDMMQAMELISQRPQGFSVISGEDALTLPMLAMGADGVISVAANAFPNEMATMVGAALKGDMKTALKNHYDLLPLMQALFEEGNPTGVKAAMEILELANPNVRLPLVKASKNLSNKISTLITELREKQR